MSQYRSDVRAAEERIEQLESLLAERTGLHKEPATPPFSIARVVGLIVVIVPLIVVLVLGGLFVLNARRDRVSTGPSHAAPPIAAPLIPMRAGFGWYASTVSPHTTGPLPVKGSNAGGRDLVVGLAMARNESAALGDRALYAVAVDRSTWKLVWHAGPFASRLTPNIRETQHIVVKDDRVVVTDAKGGVHILDAKDGAELFTHQLAHGGNACLDDDTHSVALVVESRYSSTPSNPRDLNGMLPTDINRNEAVFLDTKTGKTKHAALLPVCGERYCSKYRVDGCSDLDERSRTPSTSVLGTHVMDTWRDGSLRVSVGRNKNDPNHGVRHAVGWDEKTPNATLWESRIEDPSESFLESPLRQRRRYAHDAFDKRRFISVYASKTGSLRLVALDAMTGERTFDIEVPSTSHGTEIRSLSVDRDDIFLVIDDELRVFDARTGATRARLEEVQ